MAISSETLEIGPALLYNDTQSIVSFSVIPKCMTLNDLEWLFNVKYGEWGGGIHLQMIRIRPFGENFELSDRGHVKNHFGANFIRFFWSKTRPATRTPIRCAEKV